MMISNTLTEIKKSIYNFKIRKLNGQDEIDFNNFRGKKILIVNVASRCGFTNQYEDLEKLYQTYNDKLIVVGFPCNQFLMQEPGDEESIEKFCSLNYGVTFPMTEKVRVRGKNVHEIFEWLTNKSLNGKSNYKINWNFNKFLLDENGQIIEHFGSRIKPLDKAIVSLI